MKMEELGRYQLFEKLGEGAMGVVYRGFDPLLERKLAIKTIKLDLTPSEREEFGKRFFREAKSSARLSHPNIVMVYDAGNVGDTAYIAMELLEGQDLRRLMTKGQPTPPDLAVEIIASIADGLAYAHKQGIVHRDVKPANIMVLKDGGVKLADFGIALLQTGNRTQTESLLGTPKYMAPEQIAGLAVDGRSDIFSLGAVLYQLLTGESPFDGDTMTTVMYQVIYTPAPPPSEISARVPLGFNYILAKALAKNPDNRYQTIEKFAVDLRRYRKLAKTPPPQWNVGGIADLAPLAPQTPAEAAAEIPPVRKLSSRSSSKKPKDHSSSWFAGTLFALILAGAVFLLTKKSSEPEAPTLASRAPTPSAPTEPVPVTQETSLSPTTAAPTQRANPEMPPSAVPQQPLTLKVAKPATISLAVAPWGEVFVDGKSKGVAPPLSKLQLTPGKYRIEIKNEGAQAFVKEVDLKDGESIRLKHKF